MSDDLIKEVSKSIQGLYELTTRVDEQVKTIKDQQERLDKRIAEVDRKIGDDLHLVETEIKNLYRELNLLDRRVYIVETLSQDQKGKWEKVIDYVFRGAFVIIICYLLFLLKLNPPPLP